MTYLCYVDESGTPDVPGTSSHFVLAGLAIPIERWQEADRAITAILQKYDLEDGEVHTAWLLRGYPEQGKIAGFEAMSRLERRAAVHRYRASELLRLRKLKSPKPARQAKKTYNHTEEYTHLTRDERRQAVIEIAKCISGWDFSVLFFEAIDKIHFDPIKTGRSIGEQAFEQLVSRFEQFLARNDELPVHGLLVHDNNHTIAKRHTQMMREFHKQGTLWAKVNRINETPMFVDSKLTRMVQMADLCSYAIRRYVENGETELIKPLLARTDTVNDRKSSSPSLVAVGGRHYAKMSCECEICIAHTPWRKLAK